VFFLEDDAPIEGQQNVIDLLPDEEGYSDLWYVHKVIVDSSYVTNTYKGAADIMAAVASGDATVEETATFVNCPV
jgi:hypothetical protein